jgi:hypothetical protein
MTFKEKVKELVDATFAEDETLMAEILKGLNKEEIDELRVHFGVLYGMIHTANREIVTGRTSKW